MSVLDRKIPFISNALERAVTEAFSKEVGRRARAKQEMTFGAQETLDLQHGRQWESPENEQGEKSSEMETHSFEMSVDVKEIVAGNPFVIFQHAEIVATEMSNIFGKTLFKKLELSTLQTGNVINVAEHESFAEALAQSLEKIEISIDEQGNLQQPAIFVAPGQRDKILKQLKAAGPEYEKRIDKIKKRKKQEALQREQNRLDKFERRKE